MSTSLTDEIRAQFAPLTASAEAAVARIVETGEQLEPLDEARLEALAADVREAVREKEGWEIGRAHV